jgi:hypothetical protein
MIGRPVGPKLFGLFLNPVRGNRPRSDQDQGALGTSFHTSPLPGVSPMFPLVNT